MRNGETGHSKSTYALKGVEVRRKAHKNVQGEGALQIMYVWSCKIVRILIDFDANIL